ncbi:hypothetical protein DV515_00013233 [Chloebia gouldiae]|uniref:Uncharacterized protein n=1 Tax=Chloebia gouldiae TaxID=44316 RepID=A0A3L8S2K4_CHLGU|nr:hypothetical protein DV515_00013233 [Chloebia gouldiae]
MNSHVWVQPATLLVELLTKRGLNSISEVMRSLGLEEVELYVLLGATTASAAELSPRSGQPGLGWELSRQHGSTGGKGHGGHREGIQAPAPLPTDSDSGTLWSPQSQHGADISNRANCLGLPGTAMSYGLQQQSSGITARRTCTKVRCPELCQASCSLLRPWAGASAPHSDCAHGSAAADPEGLRSCHQRPEFLEEKVCEREDKCGAVEHVQPFSTGVEEFTVTAEIKPSLLVGPKLPLPHQPPPLLHTKCEQKQLEINISCFLCTSPEGRAIGIVYAIPQHQQTQVSDKTGVFSHWLRTQLRCKSFVASDPEEAMEIKAAQQRGNAQLGALSPLLEVLSAVFPCKGVSAHLSAYRQRHTETLIHSPQNTGEGCFPKVYGFSSNQGSPGWPEYIYVLLQSKGLSGNLL